MAYNIYTPMQGPTIPASIFSSAAERGTKSAQFMDTPETAKLKGQMLGRTKSLELQQMRENIETANIQQERQKEALEADKRANDLAPIKEGLGMVGDVLGLVNTGMQLYENYQGMELAAKEREIDTIKADTELQNKEIIINTAKQEVLNSNNKAHQAADDTKVLNDNASAMAANDGEALQTSMNTPQAQSLYMRDPDQALRDYEALAQTGIIDEATHTKFKQIYGAKSYLQNELRNKSAAASLEQKSLAAYDTSRENFYDSDTMDMFTSYNGDVPMNDAALAEFTPIPADLYEEKVEDGVRYIDKSVERSTVVGKSGHVMVHTATGRIAFDIDAKRESDVKLFNKLQRGYKAFNRNQSRILAENHLEAPTKEGAEPTPTQSKPSNLKLSDGSLSAQTAQSKREAAAIQKSHAVDLKEAKQSLMDSGVPESTIAREQNVGKGIGDWTKQEGNRTKKNIVAAQEAIKSTINSVFPQAIDNISKEARSDIDKASASVAKDIVKKYKTATPEEKMYMEENFRSKLPTISRMLGGGDLDFYFKGTDRNAGIVAKAELSKEIRASGMSREKYLSTIAEARVAEILKDHMVTNMEKFREEGFAQSRADAENMPPNASEMEANARREIAAGSRSAANPLVAAKIANQGADIVAKHKSKITGQEALSQKEQTKVKVDEAQIARAVTQVKNNYNLNRNQAQGLSVVTTRIQSVPMLAEQEANIRGVIAVESGGDYNSVSWEKVLKGKPAPNRIVGYAQIGGQAERHMNRINGTNYDRTKPEDNVELCKQYLNYLYGELNGDWELTYAAYNKGLETVRDAQHLAGGRHKPWDEVAPYMLESIKIQQKEGNLPKGNTQKMFDEVLAYPAKVLRYEEIFKQLA